MFYHCLKQKSINKYSMKINKYFAIASLLILSISCSKDTILLYEGNSFLEFGPPKDMIYIPGERLRDSLKEFSFSYELASVKEVDVFFDIYAIGGSKNYDRKFVLEQVMVNGVNNAAVDVNYKSFGSSEMQNIYVMKAGEIHMRLPVRIVRPEKDDEKIYTLKFRIVANENFALGDKECVFRTLRFTANLVRPDFWTPHVEQYTLGKYSRVKHQFFIDFTNEKWDDEFWKEIYTGININELYFLLDGLKKEISRINNEREANKLDPWKDENNILIEIP